MLTAYVFPKPNIKYQQKKKKLFKVVRTGHSLLSPMAVSAAVLQTVIYVVFPVILIESVFEEPTDKYLPVSHTRHS